MSWTESLVKINNFQVFGPLTYFILTFITTLAVVQYFRKKRHAWELDLIPGPKTLPIVGNALEFNVDPIEIINKMKEICKEYTSTSMFRIWMFHMPYIIITKASAAEVILGSSKHIEKSYDYKFLHPWLGTGLLTSSGAKWHSRRKMLTPAFHFKILEDFVEIFNQQSSVFVEKLSSKADGKPFDIFTHISLCTLDIILETAMGRSLNVQNNIDSEYVKALFSLARLVQIRQFRPWLQPDIIFKLLGYGRKHEESLKILHTFTNDTIQERRREFNQRTSSNSSVPIKKRRLAFLDLLLEYSKETQFLNDEDIREEVDTFMFEGQDTTAAAINWSIYLLGCHPEIQVRVHEEVDSLFQDRSQPITMEDLKKMPLLERCIKEALRLFPSVPFLGRELKEDVQIDGYKVPSGTTSVIPTYILHRDPKQFPDPEAFNPDRFLPENTIGRHPFAYIPFSAGPRNCIGQKFAMMEEKIVLANFFRNFRVESTTKREDLKIITELVLRPDDGNFVKLYSR